MIIIASNIFVFYPDKKSAVGVTACKRSLPGDNGD